MSILKWTEICRRVEGGSCCLRLGNGELFMNHENFSWVICFEWQSVSWVICFEWVGAMTALLPPATVRYNGESVAFRVMEWWKWRTFHELSIMENLSWKNPIWRTYHDQSIMKNVSNLVHNGELFMSNPSWKIFIFNHYGEAFMS